VKYLNVDMDTMKHITSQQLQSGLPVWMGCDVGKSLHRGSGIWDLNIFQYEELYGFRFGMDKATRLLYGQTLMTHAMYVH
jgi:bleomycin hydrolase